ncbi:MFS transporter [Ensifer soli]|uniref:MFS transporter n=1 Tax=Ciceribacter sp. sgz301302 TaxID=3342379 RepID=UPI0035B82B98
MSDQTLDTTGARPPVHYRIVSLIVASGLFMEMFDATVLATALPTMARDFDVAPQDMSIALTSYLLSLAVFIPASGKMADRFGAKTVFRAAMLLFVVSSILCSLAPSLADLVGARLLQGFAGAMMVPVGRLVILRSVPRRHMVDATSWLLVPSLLGPMLGPPVGGFITTYLDWRWIFYINIPIGILGFIAATLFIEDMEGDKATRFDLAGFLFSGASLGCLLFGFEMASRPEEALAAAALIGAGTLSGLVYLRHARGHPAPILDTTLMHIPSFRKAMIAGSLTRITQGAQPFLLPLMFQVGFGWSAAASGQLLLATSLGAIAMKVFAPRLIRRFGFRATLVANGVLASGGYAACAFFAPGWPVALIFATLMAAGLFMSLQFTAYNTVAYDRVEPHRLSAAASFYTTFQQLMLSLGICIGALSLSVSMLVAGRDGPALADFSHAFLAVTAISLAATIWNLKFTASDGADMRGGRTEAD